MAGQPCVYILASRHYGTLYIGVTSNLIAREKQLKRWHRDWKINLIERDNPHWADLGVGLGLPPLEQPAPPA